MSDSEIRRIKRPSSLHSLQEINDSSSSKSDILVQSKKIKINSFDNFKLVEVSKLSLSDNFMQHKPITKNQAWLYDFIKNTIAISNVLNDFYKPIYDPSFVADGSICFLPGKKPACGLLGIEWNELAKKYCPEKGSRLGTHTEYCLFLGVLIKELVFSGVSVNEAWQAVCDNSISLGHYKDSRNSKKCFEETGSREVCGFFDLANTRKIITTQLSYLYSIASGDYNCYGDIFPLSEIEYNIYYDNKRFFTSTGWIIIPAY